MDITKELDVSKLLQLRIVTDDNIDFNNLVLEHIKSNQPQGTLQELLNELKELLPDNPITLHELNSALLYSDTTLRADPNYSGYTTETLDDRTCQLLGLNMLTTTMLNNIFQSHNENQD